MGVASLGVFLCGRIRVYACRVSSFMGFDVGACSIGSLENTLSASRRCRSLFAQVIDRAVLFCSSGFLCGYRGFYGSFSK